jgi:NADPH:quinone reductase-like Zn-dependent oxidoreductase
LRASSNGIGVTLSITTRVFTASNSHLLGFMIGVIPIWQLNLGPLTNIDDALHLKKGQSIIIHGASSGVGTMAVRFAKLRGARVFATASGREGVALVRGLFSPQ